MLGPLMIDVAGTALDAEDRDLLAHPAVGGLILFARNYQDPAQVAALVAAARAVRPHLLIAVDHEGGRVQRFRQGFTQLPPMRVFGARYDQAPKEGTRLAELAGWLIGAELRAMDIDLAFTPVVDLDHGVSSVIGDRAFHRRAEAVTQLARALIQGLRRAGMAGTLKHFPGHGGIAADSHLELPIDPRPRVDLADDLEPFARLIETGVGSVMMAHVVYPAVDPAPASFAARWIQGELRDALGFQGAVFCDDLSMAGARVIGDMPTRARAALAAGCDMLPVCNDRQAVRDILAAGPLPLSPVSAARLARLSGRGGVPRADLLAASDWRHAVTQVTALDPALELALDA
jgi:beta-N-acetylhexosaminidase